MMTNSVSASEGLSQGGENPVGETPSGRQKSVFERLASIELPTFPGMKERYGADT
jgi:hypothetical protein